MKSPQKADTQVIVPVKNFADAKYRLSPRLGPAERANLARQMAARVIKAAAPFPVWVACDNQEVSDWALSQGAKVIWCEAAGLNGAVAKSVSELRKNGVAQAIVAHGDLPEATSFLQVLGESQVTIVADRHQKGTNVLRLPTDVDFQFSYGPNSFKHHLKEVERLGLSLEILKNPALERDVDEPSDLDSWSLDL